MRMLGLLALVACGNVEASSPDGGGDDGPPPGTPGSFVWQQNLFGSFPAVTLANDEPFVSASQFAPLDIGGGILVPTGGQDVLVAHFDANGTHLSSWRHGGTGDEFQAGMSIDPFGNPAVAGLYRGASNNAGGADLPPTSSFAGFAARYTPAGGLTWQLPLSATGELFPRNSSTNGSGNTGVAGHFVGMLDFAGNQRVSTGGKDAFYVRINDTGGVASLVTFGGAGDDTGNAAIFDPNGTVMFVGTFSGQVAFGSQMLDAGSGRDLFVVRMSTQGVPMWAIQGGGPMDVGDLPSAAVTANGDVVIAAEFQDTFQLTGGDQVRSSGATDIVLARISSTGQPLWTKPLGGAGQDRPRALAVGAGDAIALAAEFNGSATFGGDTFTSAGFIDAVVAKYTGAGGHVWSHAAGSAADDRGLGVAVDSTGAVYYTASFHNAVSFGGDALTASGTDFNGVLVKYSP